ncbi:hypothetical protein U14_00539 [Candidatus Moduliflexus flocculans]|uniref:Uncharacterized protein n=1 Tax=Candidatus Moduliflexus flocculans TaxID=1499966 RepID=A0A0S6VW18_9BACT|nr:hypothetical protein U14_00539 [Candidatus Moduliflexus flocculans]
MCYFEDSLDGEHASAEHSRWHRQARRKSVALVGDRFLFLYSHWHDNASKSGIIVAIR